MVDSASRCACVTTKGSKEFQAVSFEEITTEQLSQQAIVVLFEDKLAVASGSKYHADGCIFAEMPVQNKEPNIGLPHERAKDFVFIHL